MSTDTVVILATCTYILETLGLSLLNFSFLTIISFGCCSLVFLSSKLADEIYLVLFCGFTVSFVSVLEEELDLSNELDLFNSMSFFYSLLISFLFLV